jgi:1-acyl-sn-glycerol-3-phosphate acyltransferase
MGILIALLGILLVLCICDVRMRLAHYLQPRHRFAVMSRMQNWGFRNILALVKAYAGFRLIRRSRLQAPLPERFLIVSNHQSLADIAVLAYALPRHNVRFVAKKELGRGVPGISFMLRNGRHALIDRRGGFRKTQAELVKLARFSRRKPVCPAVFPEGTRSREGRVKAFHSAAVRTILSHHALPTLSVAVTGGHRIARFRNLLRNLRGCVYRVRLLSLYPPPARRGDVQAMLQQAHDEIERQVNEWKKNER